MKLNGLDGYLPVMSCFLQRIFYKFSFITRPFVPMMFMFLLCTWFSVSEAQNLPVLVKISPPGISHQKQNVSMECEYPDVEDSGWTIALLTWTSPTGPMYKYNIYIPEGDGPQGIYINRIFDKTKTNRTHAFDLHETNWCDMGSYKCEVVSAEEVTGFGGNESVFTAVPPHEYEEFTFDGDPFPHVNLSEPKDGNVTCTVLFHSTGHDVDITVIDEDGSSGTQEVENANIDACTHRAKSVLKVDLVPGSVKTYTCTVHINGELMINETGVITVAEGEGTGGNGGGAPLSGGEIAGIVIGVVAFVAIVLLVMWYYCKVIRKNKGKETLHAVF